MTDNDLPLLSNIEDIRARHYLINLETLFYDHIFKGKVIIFFEITTSCEKGGNYCTHSCFCLKKSEALNERLPDCDSDPHSEHEIILENKETSLPKTVTSGTTADLLNDFDMILDCCDLNVKSVTEILCNSSEVLEFLSPEFLRRNTNEFDTWYHREHLPLRFSVEEWCIKIRKPGISNVEDFPKVICIEYETSPHGKSILWRTDQDGNACVFTPAASINNRSLLPCQDPPSAMATWQAWLIVPQGYYVCMTGDDQPVKMSRTLKTGDCVLAKRCESFTEASEDCGNVSRKEPVNLDSICYYYYTTMVLPIATIAIAVGKWEVTPLNKPLLHIASEYKTKMLQSSSSSDYACKHYEYPCHINSHIWRSDTQLSIVYSPSLNKHVQALSKFLPYALKASVHLLGVYPCQRLEVAILPPCFGNLGLASPNLIFLSPTVALDDCSSYIRLSHEISHAWFGIIIGAQDWTEEWISEGFATYMEDSIFMEALVMYQSAQKAEAVSHELRVSVCFDVNKSLSSYNLFDKNTMNDIRPQLEELSNLRAHLRYRTLCSELEHSSENLRMLRPMQGESLVSSGVNCVKDGLNPEKTFLQIHYLKGYFFLKFLSNIVGREKFDALLKVYVMHFHGQLLLTEDILKFFVEMCPELSLHGITVDNLYKSWFHESGINSAIKETYSAVTNSLVAVVQHHYKYWKGMNKTSSNRFSKKKKIYLDSFSFPDQLVLLLENLLELPKIKICVLHQLFHLYGIPSQNADVRHRWCELAIKHNFPDLNEVERFLVKDHSMGVYLYGELIISRKAEHKAMAKKIFSDMEKDMDENTRLTVHSMIFGI